MKAVLFSILILPCLSQATEYSCQTPDGGHESVEAQSHAEAVYMSKQRWSSSRRGGGGCSLGSPKDSFVTNSWFGNRKHLRPYLPPDIQFPTTTQTRKGEPRRKGDRGQTGFSCDSTGGFLPDNSTDVGGCSELESATMGKWKLRVAKHDLGHPDSSDSDISLWRQSGANWQFWVRVTPHAVKQISPEARQYAKRRGFDAQGASGGPAAVNPDAGKNGTAGSPTDVVQEQIKKGIGDLLKGLGR